MKTKVAIIICSFLLIGIVGAGIFPFLSNSVEASVEVKEPVFYLEANDDGLYKDLILNKIPSFENDTYLDNGDRIIFESEPLGITDIYPANFEVHVWSKTNNSGDSLQFSVLKVDNKSLETEICSPDPVEPTTSNFWEEITSCNSTGEIILEKTDKIALEIKGAGGGSGYFISTGEEYTHGYSRIEISKQ